MGHFAVLVQTGKSQCSGSGGALRVGKFKANLINFSFFPPLVSSLRREKLLAVDLCLKDLFQWKSPNNQCVHGENRLGLDLQRFLVARAAPKGFQGWDAHPRPCSGNLCKVQLQPHLCLPRAHLLRSALPQEPLQ